MTKLTSIKTLAAALVCITTTAAASADSYAWFNGNGGLKDSYTFQLDNEIELTITAGAYDGSDLKDAEVGQYSKGLGVTHSSRDGHYLDGYGRKDVLFLEFSKSVKLEQLIFSHVDRYDDVRLSAGHQNGDIIADIDLGDHYYGYGYSVVNLDVEGTHFAIRALDNCDDVKFTGIGYHAVPSPAAAGMGLLGMLGMVSRRQRRR